MVLYDILHRNNLHFAEYFGSITAVLDFFAFISFAYIGNNSRTKYGYPEITSETFPFINPFALLLCSAFPLAFLSSLFQHTTTSIVANTTVPSLYKRGFSFHHRIERPRSWHSSPLAVLLLTSLIITFAPESLISCAGTFNGPSSSHRNNISVGMLVILSPLFLSWLRSCCRHFSRQPHIHHRLFALPFANNAGDDAFGDSDALSTNLIRVQSQHSSRHFILVVVPPLPPRFLVLLSRRLPSTLYAAVCAAPLTSISWLSL